jgi:hypothetical protein
MIQLFIPLTQVITRATFGIIRRRATASRDSSAWERTNATKVTALSKVRGYVFDAAWLYCSHSAADC